MPVIRMKNITRAFVQSQRNKAVFLFGDNITRTGFGGQAREMRGEPNTIGIPTKWRPSTHPAAYFSDSDWDYIGVRISIQSAFEAAQKYLDAGFDIIIPEAGLGTGLADLKNRAPLIAAEIEKLIAALK